MNMLLDTLVERDGVDRKEATRLRATIESCLEWCCDLLAWAPLLLISLTPT